MKLDLIQRSPEWHAWRKGKIGSSAAATIMDCNPFQSKAELWQEMKGLALQRQDSPAMQRGRELEDDAREWIEQQTKHKLPPACFVYDANNSLIASLDGWHEETKTVLEIKCSDYYFHAASIKGEIPQAVKWQLCHQFMCTDAQVGVFVAYDGLLGKTILYVRDQSKIDELLKAELTFLESLKADECPWKSPERDYTKIDITHDDVETVRLWKCAHNDLEAAKESEKALRKALIDFGDDGDLELCYEGIPIVKLTRIQKEGNIDWKKFCADRGISENDLTPYRKQEIGYYRISIA